MLLLNIWHTITTIFVRLGALIFTWVNVGYPRKVSMLKEVWWLTWCSLLRNHLDLLLLQLHILLLILHVLKQAYQLKVWGKCIWLLLWLLKAWDKIMIVLFFFFWMTLLILIVFSAWVPTSVPYRLPFVNFCRNSTNGVVSVCCELYRMTTIYLVWACPVAWSLKQELLFDMHIFKLFKFFKLD